MMTASHTLSVTKKGSTYQVLMASATGAGLLAKLGTVKAGVSANRSKYSAEIFTHIAQGLDGLSSAVTKVEGQLATAKPGEEAKYNRVLGELSTNIGRFGQRWNLTDLAVLAPASSYGGLLDREVAMLNRMTTAAPSGPQHLAQIATYVSTGTSAGKVTSLVEEARIALDAVRRGDPVEGIGRIVTRAGGSTLTDLDVVTKTEVIQIKGGDFSTRRNLGRDAAQFNRTKDFVKNKMKMFDPTTGTPLPPKKFVMHFTSANVHPDLVSWVRSKGVEVRLGPR
jgi:hypothetical protein